MSNLVPLYNLAPLLELLFLTATLAVLVLCLLRMRLHRKESQPNAQAWLRGLCLTALVLCFDLIVIGAFTRLTDSGLGCPDWPGCYGEFNPFAAHAQISEAQAMLPTGPVTHTKAWIEMVHRYWAMTLGALIMVLAFLTWRKRQALGWALFSAFWVLVQGAFGAFTVTLKLQPLMVTLHLLGGLVLLMALRMQYQSLRTPETKAKGAALLSGNRSLVWLYLGLAVLLVQAALGAWVSSNYAVLACSDYPTCRGALWPTMDFSQGFSLWRDLGKSSSGALLSQESLVAIHFVHRWFAVLVVLCLGWCTWLYRKVAPVGCSLLVAMLAAQFLTGLSSVVLGWPLLAALLHSAGSAILTLLILNLILALRHK